MTKLNPSKPKYEGDLPQIFTDDVSLRVFMEHLVKLSVKIAKVTYMGAMFHNASKINFDLSDWNTGNVQSMSLMFDGADALTDCFKNLLSTQWSKVWDTQTYGEFPYASWESLTCHCVPQNRFELLDSVHTWLLSSDAIENKCGPISEWDVSNVTNMSSLLKDASTFNANIGRWNLANVVDMSFMFYGASSFNADISSWDVGKVENMSSTFEGAAAFDVDISLWAPSRSVAKDRTFLNTGLEQRVKCDIYHRWPTTPDF
eukprot:g5231.t1